ncbi:TPA: hypothetical protein ACWV6B_002747 [Salmonella enterica subsp. enterica serovar Muenchen]
MEWDYECYIRQESANGKNTPLSGDVSFHAAGVQQGKQMLDFGINLKITFTTVMFFRIKPACGGRARAFPCLIKIREKK